MNPSERSLEFLQKNDFDSLRRLIADEPSAAVARDAAGVSLLMQCLYRGQRELAGLIADNKEPLDLFEAASLGRLDRVAQCLAAGDPVNATSKDGFTALHFACFFRQPAAVRLLLEKGAAVDAVAANPMKVMPLHSAATARDLEAARLLLEHGAPANARQHGGWVPIHSAAQNGDRALVELLLQHGAYAKLANDEGKTPAAVAREKGHMEIAALLER